MPPGLAYDDICFAIDKGLAWCGTQPSAQTKSNLSKILKSSKKQWWNLISCFKNGFMTDFVSFIPFELPSTKSSLLGFKDAKKPYYDQNQAQTQ